jgi:hypothetical protein
MTQSAGNGSRAFGLGSRRAASLVVGGALLPAVVLGIVLSLGGSSSGESVRRGTAIGTSHASTEKYGGLPAWLPKGKVPVGRVLHATRAHPALSIQGEAISVDLRQASVLASAAGPAVPEEGRTPVPETSPCTFIVTFAHATAAIPINAAAFKFIDDHGHVRQPLVTGLNGAAPPRTIVPGKPVSLTLKGVLPTGDGALAWAPGSARPIASWDFTVEID